MVMTFDGIASGATTIARSSSAQRGASACSAIKRTKSGSVRNRCGFFICMAPSVGGFDINRRPARHMIGIAPCPDKPTRMNNIVSSRCDRAVTCRVETMLFVRRVFTDARPHSTIGLPQRTAGESMNIRAIQTRRREPRLTEPRALPHAECPIEQRFGSDDPVVQQQLMQQAAQGTREVGHTVFVADYNGLRVLAGSEVALESAAAALRRRFGT